MAVNQVREPLRVGFSLSDSKTKDTDRFNSLLLIIAIATLGLWLIGAVAKQKNMQYQFQANTIRSRDVLSNVFLGWQVIHHLGNYFTKKELLIALENSMPIFNLDLNHV